MREIKFRAWCPPLSDGDGTLPGKMIYDLVQQKYLAVRTASRDVPTSIDIEHVTSGLYDLNAALADYGDRLMQYTGLKDKNGKEIYEGDVLVRFNHDEESQYERLLVEWDTDTASFVLIHKKEDGRKSWINMKSSLDADMGVIGDIYQNPELLSV